MTAKEIYKRYSEPFKRQVVAEYEKGASISELCRKYDIGGAVTVQKWIKKYAREGLRHEIMHIQTPTEAQRVQQLTQEIQVLRQALADLTIKNLLLEGTLQVYQNTYGDSVLKKKRCACLHAAHVAGNGSISMDALCRAAGISRQAYYQALRRHTQRLAQEARILSLVRMLRQRQPRLGTRKLWVCLRPLLAQEGLRIGHDRLFALLRQAGLLLSRQRKGRRTTWAGSLRVPNRVAGLRVTRIHQVWVSDITYIALQNGQFVYLFVVMDLYSRVILGWTVGTTLAAEHALTALQQAFAQAGTVDLQGLIHHSDHGVQYTSREYQAALSARGMLCSMGEVGNSYDNAYAERVIGILKQEYGLELPFVDLAQARTASAEGIHLYNWERPHQALNYAVPGAVYEGKAVGQPFTVYKYQPVSAKDPVSAEVDTQSIDQK